MSEFSERLKELRKAANITQTGLAEKLNLHPQTVSKWERGLSEPDISQLGEIAAALGITMEKLCGQPQAEQTFVGEFQAEQLGKMICEQRIARQESQEQLAAFMQTSTDAVSRWERGVTCPDVSKLIALADHFELPVSRLWCGIGEEQATESVVMARKRQRRSVIWLAAAAAMVCLTAIFLVVFLPRGQEVSPGIQPQLYTVSVNGENVSVAEGTWYMPETPSKEGYDFAGWRDVQGEEVTFPRAITGDIAVTAVYAPHEYTIDYWLNGGYFRGSVQTEITLESGSVALPVPEKAGEVFEGWYVTSDYSGEAVECVSCTGSDLSLYAKWSDAVYSVRYELDGGVLYESNPSTVTVDRVYPLAEPVREGYLFLGWYDGPKGGERYDRVGGENAVNVTLYALWQRSDVLFSILYDYADGEPTGDNPVSVGAGEVYELSPASKAGHTFLGWNTQKDGSGKYVERLYGVDETLHLYAIFEPKEYVIRYIYQGTYEGEEENPNTVVFGERVELLPVALYGHEFLGWYDAEEGGDLIEVIDKTNILTFTTLYARFAPLTFELTLDACGGNVLSDRNGGGELTLTVAFDETIALPDCALTGHEFLGWNERADGSGKNYVTFTGKEGDQTLYALYAEKEYLIRYQYDGLYESGKVNPNYITYGDTVTLHPVYLAGYEFLGWFDAEEGGKQITVIDESNILQIMWLYARFAPLEYQITLDAGEGTLMTPDGARSLHTYLLQYGTTLELPLCTREGYAFLGWLDGDGNGVEEISTVNIRDMTLTASWLQTGVEYRIDYVLDGGTMQEDNPETALSDVCAPLYEPVRDGYLFLGWYDNVEGAGEPYSCTPFGRMDDLTLYALWQEMKVSGSAEYFDYEKTSSEVTITGYHGPTGANVDVVIPSVVDCLPVTRIGSNVIAKYGANMVRYSIFGAPNSAQIRSLTIPEGVVVLKESAFNTLTVMQPLQLPSTLERIEARCFEYYKGDILFSDGGNLSYIGEYAFHQVRFVGTLVIPYGVKIIDSSAFYGVKVCGVILPDTVEMIFDYAFYVPNGYLDIMYIPSSVKYIRSTGGRIYTSLSEEEVKALNGGYGWSNAVYNVQKSAITLCDGETRRTLTGEAFDLPSPQKEGYTFLGWQDESGEFVGDCYIPNRNATLTAVWEKQWEQDGRTQGSAAVLAVDMTYDFYLTDGQGFYFRPDTYQSCRIVLSVNGNFRCTIYRIRDNAKEYAGQIGSPIDFRAGDVYYAETDPIPSGTIITIRIMLLPT